MMPDGQSNDLRRAALVITVQRGVIALSIQGLGSKSRLHR